MCVLLSSLWLLARQECSRWVLSRRVELRLAFVASPALSLLTNVPLTASSTGFWGTAHEFDKYYRSLPGYSSEVGYTGGDISLGTPSSSSTSSLPCLCTLARGKRMCDLAHSSSFPLLCSFSPSFSPGSFPFWCCSLFHLIFHLAKPWPLITHRHSLLWPVDSCPPELNSNSHTGSCPPGSFPR